MRRVIGGVGATMVLVFGVSVLPAGAQDRPRSTPSAAQPRWSLEGAAGLQVYYDGTMQSVAFGFAPTRSMTLLVHAERSYIQDRIQHDEDGYASERGGTERFVSAEFRYAFFTSKRVSPYLLGGSGRGTSRPNVSAVFPDEKVRDIQVVYYGGGVRIAAGPRLDVVVDTRLTMAAEARTDYFGVRMPVRVGIAWRF